MQAQHKKTPLVLETSCHSVKKIVFLNKFGMVNGLIFEYIKTLLGFFFS